MTTFENTRLDEVEEKIDTVENKIDAVESKVDQVLTALVGSDLTLNKGLVRELQEMKGRILKLEMLKNKMIWMAMGAGIAGGFSIKTIIEWIQGAAR